MQINMKPPPSKDDLLKAAEAKMQAALALRCPEHNQGAQLKVENRKPFLDGFCCPAFEDRVKQFIEG